jgi:glycine C-acetyltransferase|tara:strand:- start:884 stop:1192 length:309 start_codon:yes stop_codon:yes gene_type:complete
MINGKTILNFSTSNFLGLANHPRINKKAKDTIDEFGFGMASVRRVCGTINIHKELEAQITKFHKGGDTVLFAADFDPNSCIFESLLKKEDCILSDELNGASI